MELLELYSLAERDGITVDAFELTERCAFSIQDERGYYIAIDPFKIETAAEEKTLLGHELGHCETGAFYNRHSPYDIRQRHENRADKWAIKRLVPEDELTNAAEGGLTSTWELAEHFGVTEDLVRKALCWYRRGTLDVASVYGVA